MFKFLFGGCMGKTEYPRRSNNARAREMLDQSTEYLIPEVLCVFEPASNGEIVIIPPLEPTPEERLGVHGQYHALQCAGEFSTESVVIPQENAIALGDPAVVVHPIIGEIEMTPNGGPSEPTPNVVMACVHEPVQVICHRRVRRHRKVPCVQLLVAECKVRFGTPTDTMANRRSVQRFAVQILNKHGVRAAHSRTIVPIVVELVLTPDRWEVDAIRLTRSRFIRTRRGKGLTLWQRILNWWDGDWKIPPMEEC